MRPPWAPRTDGRLPPRRAARDRAASDRAASDAIGYVFVFSIILFTLAIVYTGGFNSVTSMQRGEQLQNSVRTFETIESNFDDIERRQAPARAAEVNLNGGRLAVVRSSNVSVNVTGTSFDRTVTVGTLSYRLRDQFVEYENGAVVRRTLEEGGVVVTEANFDCAGDVAVVSLVVVQGNGTTVSGDGVATITTERTETGLLYPADRTGPEPTGINVSVDSPNEDAWERHLAAAPGWTDPDGDGTYRCEADQVFVRRTVLNLSVEV